MRACGSSGPAAPAHVHAHDGALVVSYVVVLGLHLLAVTLTVRQLLCFAGVE